MPLPSEQHQNTTSEYTPCKIDTRRGMIKHMLGCLGKVPFDKSLFNMSDYIIQQGWHKPSSGHYYAIHLRPNGSTIPGCDHPNVDIRNLFEPSCEVYETKLSKIIQATNQNDYEKKQKETGISKPSILSGLVKSLTLPVLLCFSIDLMHLLCINIGELLIPLWHRQLKCDPTDKKDSWDWATLVDDTWITYGKLVAEATKHFPSFFHCSPCNPVEKISSGYKATKYSLVWDLVSFEQFSLRNIGAISANLFMEDGYSFSVLSMLPKSRKLTPFSFNLLRNIKICTINDTLIASTSADLGFILSCILLLKSYV